MLPQKNKPDQGSERTEEFPAQEKIATGFELILDLPAEQVFSMRMNEIHSKENTDIQGFVP